MSETVTMKVHFAKKSKGQKVLRKGEDPRADQPEGRVPRVSRLMALALKFDRLIADGVIEDQAELARLGHVTRARTTQIMGLLYLAPDIQDEILHLPRVTKGCDPVAERHIRPIVR